MGESDSGQSLPHATRGALYVEHVALRAGFARSEENGIIYPESYDGETELDEALAGAVVADLTGSTYRLVSGTNPQTLCEEAFCAKKLDVGECAFEPALTGKGSITSVPLLARSGAHEYVVLDCTSRGAVAAGWITFLAGIEQDGVKPFECTTVEDASAMLIPLLVAGHRADELVSDYLGRNRGKLPRRGTLTTEMLDNRIPAIVMALPMGEKGQLEAYVLLVQPMHAQVVWRSMLSFSWATPVGMNAVRRLLSEQLPWVGRLESSDVVEFSEEELRGWGLLRDGSDFVGYRGVQR